jgi:hypothetical protein
LQDDALMTDPDAKMHTMRTTINIDEDLYRRAKARAARSGQTVSEVIEDAVRAALRPRPRDPESPELPVVGGTGLLPGIELSDNPALLDAMNAGEPLDALR